MPRASGWVLGVIAAAALAQTAPPPAFEVASIKPYTEGRMGMFPTTDTLYIGNRSLSDLITAVYRLYGYQVKGREKWMDSEAYTIVAKSPRPAKFGEMMEMTNTLLADLFHLKFHWETRELPTYWLVVAKGGSKLRKPADDGKPGGLKNRPHDIEGYKMPISNLLFFLQGEIQIPIVDKTGIGGDWDFHLVWADDPKPSAAGEMHDMEKPSLITAVQEQLGLKLEPHPGPVQILVIDHAEKPELN